MLGLWKLAIGCSPRFADGIKPRVRALIGTMVVGGAAPSLIIRQNRENDFSARVKRAIRQKRGRRSGFRLRLYVEVLEECELIA